MASRTKELLLDIANRWQGMPRARKANAIKEMRETKKQAIKGPVSAAMLWMFLEVLESLEELNGTEDNLTPVEILDAIILGS